MIHSFNRLFVNHPREVGESYLHHAGVAGRMALRLAKLSGCAIIHAVTPGLHRTTVSDEVKRMADEMGYRAEIAREARMREAGAFDPGL